MSKTDIALSWSRISQYRQCPSQFKSKYIDKDYPDEGENPNFVKGNKVHKQLENYIIAKKKGTTIPAVGNIAAKVIPLINSYFREHNTEAIFAEQQVALDHDWKSTSWFGKPVDVKFRGIADMLIFPGDGTCIVIDFKTGQYRPYDEDFGQLHLAATFIFEQYPDIHTVKAVYLFAEHRKKIVETFIRDGHAAIKAKFDVEYIQINEDTEFEPTKNQYCFFCLIKENCKYG